MISPEQGKLSRMGSIPYRLANLQFLNAKPVTTKNRSQYNTCIYNLINDARILFKVDLSKYYYQYMLMKLGDKMITKYDI